MIDENFGKMGEDRIRGLKGVITARADFITGCSQYQLTPKAVKNIVKDSLWVDEGRILIDGEKLIPDSKEMSEFGKLAKDSITGFEGVITEKSYFKSGLIYYNLTPKSIDNSVDDCQSFDSSRIEIIDECVNAEEIKVEKTGGPERRIFNGY